MKPGEKVRAVWRDGLVVVGRYSETSRGYVILIDDDGKKVVCDPGSVKFEVINDA